MRCCWALAFPRTKLDMTHANKLLQAAAHPIRFATVHFCLDAEYVVLLGIYTEHQQWQLDGSQPRGLTFSTKKDLTRASSS